jgi:hypothetical protein
MGLGQLESPPLPYHWLRSVGDRESRYFWLSGNEATRDISPAWVSCGGVIQRGALCRGVAWPGLAQFSMAGRDMLWRALTQCGAAAWRGGMAQRPHGAVAWHSAVLRGMSWGHAGVWRGVGT